MGIVATVLFGAGATVACGGSSAAAAPPAVAAGPTAPDDVAAGLSEHHRFHHHGGVTLFIAMSVHTLGVSAEQRAAVEKIKAELHARMEPARAAEQSLMTALADGIAGTNLDTARVDAAVAQVSAASAAAHEASADALNQLHAVLTPAERAALVDKVEAHWAVWQSANADEVGPAHPEGGRLAKLGTELDLSRNQLNQIRASFDQGMKGVPRLDPMEIASHLRAFGDAFRSETFDARSLATGGSANAHLSGWGAAYMAHLMEAVSPVLSPEQRATLAQRLREHATHDPIAEGGP